MKKLNSVLDQNDHFIRDGHHIVKARTRKREVPAWTSNNGVVRKLLLRSFPNLATDPVHRERAARWASVIHLYFRMGYTCSQIAEEIDSTTTKIYNVIRAISRVSRGFRSDGRGSLGKPKGRPKKNAV